MTMNSGGMRVAVGLMSGTSMDGIDAAMIRTDGATHVESVSALSFPYTAPFRERLSAILGTPGSHEAIATELTNLHGDAVSALLEASGTQAEDIDVIGFHGHTVLHDPKQRRTLQIGDGEALAHRLGIDVVFDFRSADVAAGGQGAPFAPIFHAVLAGPTRPVCFLNIGGVANLTWIGSDADPQTPAVFDHLLAFDTGPGNALIDDWVQQHTGALFDTDGALAADGVVDGDALARLLSHDYFGAPPPKSLDRNDFDARPVTGLSVADGAATLSRFTIETIMRAARFLPEPPTQWLVTGGGRKNAVLMAGLAEVLDAPVVPTEAAGVDGDALEAQAFAYLAVRSLCGMPLSGPSTTGVPTPQTGGRIARWR
jgi:anhydro-N-acetylmuramic acid kinase